MKQTFWLETSIKKYKNCVYHVCDINILPNLTYYFHLGVIEIWIMSWKHPVQPINAIGRICCVGSHTRTTIGIMHHLYDQRHFAARFDYIMCFDQLMITHFILYLRLKKQYN